MVYAVAFTPEAVDQLEAIFEHVAHEASSSIAARHTEAIVATCEGLASFPLIGLSRDDIRAGLRITHYRGDTIIAYSVDEALRRVSILGLFHARQNYAHVLTVMEAREPVPA